MSQLKWFDGGDERSNEAKKYLIELQQQLNKPEELRLKKLLEQYTIELSHQSSSVPFVLSRLNIDISHCLIHYPITLSKESEDLMKKLSSLSQIRYGY